MSVESNGQLKTFSCDYAGCDETFEAAGEFKDVWAEAKDEGWRAFMKDDEWQHRCPQHRGM